jgi:uncharacterized membrane protein YfcA
MLSQILLFVAIGFFAQMIDGALGMAYGVSATTFLLSFGVAPALASASVHAAEVVTTALSGLSHWRLGNVDMALFRRLVIPGVLGAITGSYILTQVNGDKIKPWVSGYLLLMGILIFVKAFRKIAPATFTHHLIPLGLLGGFLDASGGGGWGPVVVSTLVAFGNHPRMTIGSANLAEFFVAFSASITFIFTLEQGSLNSLWPAILGLALGGAIAAPLAALFARKIPARTLMLMVGVLIIALSVRTILMTVVK